MTKNVPEPSGGDDQFPDPTGSNGGTSTRPTGSIVTPGPLQSPEPDAPAGPSLSLPDANGGNSGSIGGSSSPTDGPDDGPGAGGGTRGNRGGGGSGLSPGAEKGVISVSVICK